MKNNFNKKTVVLLLMVFVLGATAAFAGTTDTLGAKDLWTTLSGWLDDTSVARIIALMFFSVGIWRAFAGSILQFFLMLGFAVLITQGNKIISAISTALF